jgi:Immunity protein Imm5
VTESGTPDALSMPFRRAVEQGRSNLRADPAGHLSLGLRESIWVALGPRGREDGQPGAGWRRRAALAFESCERVLPLWEAAWPEDRQPNEVLALARGALEGEAAPEEARARAGRLWGRAETLTQLAGDPARASVGFACAKAVEVALEDEYFDPSDVDPMRSERGLDLFDVDTAFVASSASAGGPPWVTGTDPEARRAFWDWWLAEACERTWKTAAD